MERWPQTLAAAGALLRERFGIEHVTLQPELRAGPAPRTSLVRVWRSLARDEP